MKKIILTLCAVLLTASMAFAANIPVSADVANVVRLENVDGGIHWSDADADGILVGESDTAATVSIFANTTAIFQVNITGDFIMDGPAGATIPYQIKFNGLPYGHPFPVYVSYGTPSVTIPWAVSGNIVSPVAPNAGSYTDTLVVTVGF